MPALATTSRKPSPPPRADRYRAEDPDVRLMLRVRMDDGGAFTDLVQRYWTRIFEHFYRRLGDRQEAEDLAQDVFLRLYRYRKRYQPRAKFTTWLFHVTQNVARNALRSRRRHPTVPLASASGPAEDGAGPEGRTESPSRPLERAEVAEVVRSAVSGLGHRQRTAVELHQFLDRTYADVAAELDMSPKAAKSLLYRARNQLRVSLSSFMETGTR
jgi:RNA polymerase sigma-70 factor (ECF subfamily)